MEFCIVGEIASDETHRRRQCGIRELAPVMRSMRLALAQEDGIATVRLLDGTTARAELHWYEAHGIGKVKLKIKEWI